MRSLVTPPPSHLWMRDVLVKHHSIQYLRVFYASTWNLEGGEEKKKKKIKTCVQRLLLHTGCAHAPHPTTHTYSHTLTFSTRAYLLMSISILPFFSTDTVLTAVKASSQARLDLIQRWTKLANDTFGSSYKALCHLMNKAPTTCAKTWYRWHCQQSSSTGPYLLCPQGHCERGGASL